MPDNEGIIEIYRVDNFYNGKIIWMLEKEKDGSPLKDKENPLIVKEPLLLVEVMRNYKYDEDAWS